MPKNKGMSTKAQVYKTATKVRARQVKAGKPISLEQAKQKSRQIVRKRADSKSAVDVAFGKLASGTPFVTRTAKAKTGPTAKTKTVRRIAERRGISRKAANAVRKARKK
jgi:hypothetical protein